MDACSIALRRMGDTDSRSVAVTSTSRREGRTTVAIGLAAASATQHHRSTILIDLDVQRGAIGKQTSLATSPGLTDFLLDHTPIEHCLQQTSDQLSIITAGVPREPAEIKLDRLSELIEDLQFRCDVLIADLPPLSSGVVAARMADLFESVALVVRAGRISVPHIEKSVSVLNQRPFVILNAEAVSRAARIRKALSLRS
jgi:Mrp family chromosome partitioning ATPase